MCACGSPFFGLCAAETLLLVPGGFIDPQDRRMRLQKKMNGKHDPGRVEVAPTATQLLACPDTASAVSSHRNAFLHMIGWKAKCPRSCKQP